MNHLLTLNRFYQLGFPGSSAGKEFACNAGDPSSILGSGRCPGKGYGNPLQHSFLENPHGQRSLVGYSPWGHKESDTTERLSTAQHIRSQVEEGTWETHPNPKV